MMNNFYPATADSLRRAAARFRSAIERCERKHLPITFEDFPRGSCGDASLLLGTFLTESGFGAFEYILGERGAVAGDTWHSHAWIEGSGFIVDITADQFNEGAGPVIVLPVAESDWHKTFTQEREEPADYRIYDASTQAELSRAYCALINVLTDSPIQPN